MRLLILGGTAFLGRAVAAHALAAGHDVTCLARGERPAPEGAELRIGDRDAEDGLAAVGRSTGAHWDAVVDVTRHPGQVRRALRDLDVGRYVFVSTGNVYAEHSRPEQDESSALLDPLDGDEMTSMEVYGPAKVACEAAIAASGVPAAIVRSGLIGGPGDWSGRSGYYPWRFAHPIGEHVVVPDDAEFPCALVDVRDLAGFLVHLAEEGTTGVFNATGPTTTLGAVLETARTVAGSSATPLPVSPARLEDLGVSGWMGPAALPLWIADDDWRWFATLDTRRAREAGLRTRPLVETLADALAFEERRDVDRATGLSDADEARVQEAVVG